MVSKLPPVVQGEPVVSADLDKRNSTSNQRPLFPKPLVISPPPRLLSGETAPVNIIELGLKLSQKLKAIKSLSPTKLTLPRLLNEETAPVNNIKPALKLSEKLREIKCLSPTKLALPKLTPSPQLLKLSVPNASDLPKLTPISDLIKLSPQKGSSTKLTKISKPLQVALVKKTSLGKLAPTSKSSQPLPPMLKLMPPSRLTSPLKLKMLSQSSLKSKLSSQSSNLGSNLEFFRKKIIAKRTFEKAPEYLHAKPNSDAQNSNEQFIPLSYQLASSQQLSRNNEVDLNQEMNFVSNNEDVTDDKKVYKNVRVQNIESNLVISTNTDSSKFENILLEHKYTKTMHKNISDLNVMETQLKYETTGSGKTINKLFGNNHVKMWLKQKNLADKKTESTSTCLGINRRFVPKTKVPLPPCLISKLKSMSPTKATSVIVLKPFDKSHVSEPVYLNNKKLFQRHNLDLYECPVCKFSALSSTYLQLHMRIHEEHVNSGNKTNFTYNLIKEENKKIIKRKQNTTQSNKLQDEKIANKSKESTYKKTSGKRRIEDNVDPTAIKKSEDLEFIRWSNLVSTVQVDKLDEKSNKKCVKNLNTKVKHSSVDAGAECESGSEKGLASLKTEDLKPIGSVIDGSGRRLSLRKRNKLFNSKMSCNLMAKNNKSNVTVSEVLTKNPIVLLSKLDLNTVSSVKPKDHSVLIKSIEAINSNSYKGSKGGESSSQAGCDGNNSNQPKLSVRKDKKSSHFKTKKGDFDKCGTKSITKDKKLCRIFGKNHTDSCSKLSKDNIQVKESSSNRKVQCSKCQLFVQKEKLNSHMLLHMRSNYYCKLCNMKFEKSFLLRRHVLSDHKVVNQFSCLRRDCSRKFQSRRDLDKHMRSHRK